jgi:uncharacterized integral membrane protein
MQHYFVNVIALLSFLMGLIPTVVVYRNRVIELQNRANFWRTRAQDLEAQIIKEVNRG